MLEFGQILGLFSAVVLVVAVDSFVKLGWSSAPHAAHDRAAANPPQAELASRLMVVAFGLSALAAIFAVVGWIGL